MGRGDYRTKVIQTSGGDAAAKISEKHARELMTPDLHAVKGPLNTKVWRYMRLEHLERALRESLYYLPRVELLGDPWEGSFSDPIDYSQVPALKDWGEKAIQSIQASSEKNRRETMQRLFYASCWHMNSDENEHLWKRYGDRSDESVAISSTIASLCTLRPTSPINVADIDFIPKMYAGEVNYVDLGVSGSIPNGSLSLFYKDNVYSADREFRVIIELYQWGFSQHYRDDLPNGVELEFEPATVFHQIVINPNSPGLLEKINTILDEVEYDIPVIHSKLSRKATW